MYGGRRFFRLERNNEDAGRHGNEHRSGRTEAEQERSKNSAGSQKETDFHKIIWEEYFPQAFAIGIHIDEFLHLTPKKLKYCLEGHRLKKKIDDESMWNWFGNYAISAFIVAIDIAFNGKKSKAEYIDLPLLATEEEREAKRERDLQKQRDEFLQMLLGMQKNFENEQKLKKMKQEKGDKD